MTVNCWVKRIFKYLLHHFLYHCYLVPLFQPTVHFWPQDIVAGRLKVVLRNSRLSDEKLSCSIFVYSALYTIKIWFNLQIKLMRSSFYVVVNLSVIYTDLWKLFGLLNIQKMSIEALIESHIIKLSFKFCNSFYNILNILMWNKIWWKIKI